MKNIIKAVMVFALLICVVVTFASCGDDDVVYVTDDSTSETVTDTADGSDSEEIEIGQGDKDGDKWGELIYVG